MDSMLRAYPRMLPSQSLLMTGRHAGRHLACLGQTMSDVLDTVKVPVIASHSSARALTNHPRNVPDELLRRIAKWRRGAG